VRGPRFDHEAEVTRTGRATKLDRDRNAEESGKSLAVLAPGRMVDHFKVIRLAGRGGMGEVHLARDTKLGRKVALKLVHRDALAMNAPSNGSCAKRARRRNSATHTS